MKFLDDTFWGTVRNSRVKWVGYDSGIMPVKKKKAAAANSDSNGHGELPDANSKIGHYYPMKENTRRFEIMKERAEKAARSK